MNNIILDARGFGLFCPFIHIPNYAIHDVFFSTHGWCFGDFEESERHRFKLLTSLMYE